MYSIALIPRNASANRIVIDRQTTAARGLSVRAKWIASATVSELLMSTSVLTVPAQISLERLAAANAAGNEKR